MFVDGTALPIDRERVLTGQTVLVRDGRIAAVGPNASVRVPADAERIDAKGKFLTPGSRRMHAHVLGPQQPEQLPGARVGHEERGLYVERDLKEDGKFGRVAVGNWADLVLLDGNPLESLDIIGQRAGVMVRGRWGPGVRHRR